MAVEVLTLWVVPIVIGIVIGIFSGMLGIGGGTLMVPIFRLAFGMTALMSTATSLFAIVPTSVAGAISHLRNNTCLLPLGLALGIGGACTSPIGVWLATISPSWTVMAAAALVIAYSAITMLRKAFALKPTKKTEEVVDASKADALSPEEGGRAFRIGRKQLVIGAVIGLGAGIVSGYVGVGGGFIMVPLMLSVLGIPMKKASGTSLVAVAILAIPAVISQAFNGNIDYIVGIAVAVGSIPGAVIGSHLVRIIPERALRFMFGGFLFVAAALLFANEAGIF